MSDDDVIEVGWTGRLIDGEPAWFGGRLELDEAARLERGEPAQWLTFEVLAAR